MSFAIAGAGVGALLGGIGANANNKRIKGQAHAAMREKNKEINRQRIVFFDQRRISSKNLQQGLGSIGNVVSDNFQSGQSINDIFATEVGDAQRDQFARDENLNQIVESLHAQKESIAAQASAQTSSVAMGVVSGAMSGYSIGSSIDSGLSKLGAAADQKDMLSGLKASLEANPGDPDSLAKLKAFTSGVPVSLLQETGAIGAAVLRPFKIQMQTDAMRIGDLSTRAEFAKSVNFAAARNLNNSIGRYDNYRNSLFGNSVYNPANNPFLGY